MAFMRYPELYSIRAMLRLLSCAALAALIAGDFPIVGRAQETSPSGAIGGRDLRGIVADGVIRVAITKFDIPPFHQRRLDGTLFGKDIDFINKLGLALNIKIAIVDDGTSFDSVVDAIANGRADIGVSKLSQSYRRVINVRFSDPYVTFHHAILFDRAIIARDAKGEAPDEALRNFRGRIGVIGASVYVDFATKNYPAAQIVEFSGWDETIRALQDHKVDMVYRDEFEVRRILKLNPAIHIQFGAAIVADQVSFLSVAICDSCTKLQEFVNYFIAQNRNDYTIDGLLSDSPKD
jgi:polar amino acid transport system substrate-binding protein